MKLKIRLVVLLMIVAITGIISFQLFWISNTYQLTEKRFKKDVVDAIDHTIESNILSMVDEDFGEEFLGDTTIKYSIDGNLDFPDFLKDNADFISVTMEQSGSIEDESKNKTDTLSLEDALDKEVMKEKLSGIITNVLAVALEPEYDIDVLDSLLIIELHNRNIFTEFNISILKKGDKALEADGSDDEGTFVISRSFSPLNKSDQVLQVTFPSRVSLIIKKMWLSLLGSILLIIIVVGSFLLMLSIIYKQKRLSVMKGDFINNMTHEFKTPIATVSVAIEALTSFGALDNKAKTEKYLSLSKNELQRLTLMVEKVLRIAEYEREDISLNKEELDIKTLVENISNRYLVHKDKAIEIVNGIPPSATLFADSFHIKTIISNLIDNSVKYSGDSVKIEIDFTETEQKTTLTVKDNGIGIAKEKLKYIFDKFYRITDGNLYKVKGFGLGLSYVKHLVSEHQGEIQVSSHLGEGTSFKIELPKQ